MIQALFHSVSLLAQSSGASGDAAGAAAGIVGLVFACGFMLIGLVAVVFWVWMLVDCLTRDFPGSEKIVWVLVIIFLQILGALVYFFIGRSHGTKKA